MDRYSLAGDRAWECDVSAALINTGLFNWKEPPWSIFKYIHLKETNWYHGPHLKLWFCSCSKTGRKSRTGTFEEVLDSVPEEIQMQLLFHLNLFL
jgi:hypothetical protein